MKRSVPVAGRFIPVELVVIVSFRVQREHPRVEAKPFVLQNNGV